MRKLEQRPEGGYEVRAKDAKGDKPLLDERRGRIDFSRGRGTDHEIAGQHD